jgi:hypothetical protein
MNARRISLLWFPRRLAPHNAGALADALEQAIPRVALTVHLQRDRYGWTVTRACAGDPRASPHPLEYKPEVAAALQRAGLFVRDCPICGDPVDVIGTEPRRFELRERGVAPEHSHARYYAHRHTNACTPVELWARFAARCACGAPLRFVVKAAEAVQSGGSLACECGARYALEPRVTGGGIAVETAKS